MYSVRVFVVAVLLLFLKAACGRKSVVHSCYFPAGSLFVSLLLIFTIYLILELKIGMRGWKSTTPVLPVPRTR